MAKRATDRGRLKSLRFTNRGIAVELRPAAIDTLALDFASKLDRQRVRYAIVSGYTAILLGRSRESEDVDVLARPLSLAAFSRLHCALIARFDCITPGTPSQLFHDYLHAGRESTAVRYAERNSPVPNVEFKFAKTELHRYSLSRRIAVRVNGRSVHVGPLDVQVAYKVWLGSPKDLEDARWIYRVAAGHLDDEKIRSAGRRLHLPEGAIADALETR